jgi:hypothetical protein
MDDKLTLLIEDAAIKARVNVVWEKVFLASSIVIAQAKKFGFLGMDIIPDPNIHQMLVTIRLLDDQIDTFVDHEDVEYNEERLMLNAKKQLAKMEIVAAALKANNREDFDAAIAELEGQAAF